MESVPLVQGNADLEGYKSSVELQSPHPVQEDVGIFQTEHSESRVVEVNLTANGKSDDVMSPHPVQEDACIFQAGHSESGVVEMNTTANDKSDVVIRLLIDPRRDLSNPEEETVLSPCVSQEIIDLCELTSEENQVFAQCSGGSSEEIPSLYDNPVKSLSELLFESLGKLRNCLEKIVNLVTSAPNSTVIDYASAFTGVKDTCKDISAATKQVHDVAEIQLKEIAHLPSESFDAKEQETPVEHDPGKRSGKLTESPIKYLIHIGPCQPKLSAYTKNNDLVKKGKQSCFCPTWYKDYPYLEYSISENKAFCFVCSLFGRGLGREKAETAWVDGVDYWSKMKGSRGKNKMGKLDTHFGSVAHASALQDYLHFVRNDKHFDILLTKEERERMLEFENEPIKNREVVEILIDIVLVLTRNGLALRGSESTDNHDDGNFCEIVNLIARHNPVVKSWLANRGKRKYGTTYMSPQSQNEFVVLLGEEIQQIISEKVRKSGYCSVTAADTTPDVSHTDQLGSLRSTTRQLHEAVSIYI